MTPALGTADRGTRWTDELPNVRGTLPNGSPVYRTDPSGRLDAPIAILGAYPATLGTELVQIAGVRCTMPKGVERESFESGSRSGAVLEREYLGALGLTWADCVIIDMMPYYLANTSRAAREATSLGCATSWAALLDALS